MTHADAFFETVAAGRENTVEQWHQYLELFHATLPEANELFTYLRRGNGQTSYAVMAASVAAAGARRILDLGCGDGNLIEELLERVPGVAITAIDNSPAELDIARRRYGQSSNVTFVHGDIRKLPFEDSSFDCVLSHQTINFFPNIAQPIAEAARVLSRGGTFMIAANRSFKNYRTANWQRLNNAALDSIRTMHPEFRWPRMGDSRAYNEEGLRELFASPAWEPGSIAFHAFNVSAMTTPLHVRAIFSRLYLYATMRQRNAVLDAVEQRAIELAMGEFIDVELPFRLTTVRRADA